MKVKFLVSNNFNELELSVNSFIKGKEIIDLKYSSTAYVINSRVMHEYSCLIQYYS